MWACLTILVSGYFSEETLTDQDFSLPDQDAFLNLVMASAPPFGLQVQVERLAKHDHMVLQMRRVHVSETGIPGSGWSCPGSDGITAIECVPQVLTALGICLFRQIGTGHPVARPKSQQAST